MGKVVHVREMTSAAQNLIVNSIKEVPLEINCNIILKCIRLLTGFV